MNTRQANKCFRRGLSGYRLSTAVAAAKKRARMDVWRRERYPTLHGFVEAVCMGLVFCAGGYEPRGLLCVAMEIVVARARSGNCRNRDVAGLAEAITRRSATS